MDKSSKIFVAGGQTSVGVALIKRLINSGYTNLVGVGAEHPVLSDAYAVERFFADATPAYVFLVGGMSGGIALNQERPADLMLDNLLTECHVIHSAHRHKITKLLYLASSCIYPRESPQPIKEEFLLNGPLESTNQSYAVAKIAGLTLCRSYRYQHGDDFIVGVPANFYGPNDDFSLDNSHVIAALIRKTHEGKKHVSPKMSVWGTGTPEREFIFVEDLADACVFLMDNYEDGEPINIAGGAVISIKELAVRIKEIVGYDGNLEFDTTKPDGMQLKGLDSTKLRALGWNPNTSLNEGLASTYRWYKNNVKVGVGS